MRDLTNCHLDWAFAHYGEHAVVQKLDVSYFCPECVALDLIRLESVQLDEFVQAPDPDRAIETGRDKAGVRVFDQFHGCDRAAMTLECMHHLLGLEFEVPLED